MPPEATATPEPISESPNPAVEAPVPEPVPITPEPTSAPAEASPAPETAQPTTPTAQIPPNEPIATESEPFDSAQDKPTPTPEPPSAAAPVPTGILHSARDLLNKARVAIQDRKRKKRDKIMQLLTTKNKITNDEVEKLLHVSDATATRYLSALEKENKIKQVGKTGHGVVYSKI
jgi:hypothetical protein